MRWCYDVLFALIIFLAGGGGNVSTQLNKIYKKGLVGLRFVNAELINTP